MVDRVSRWVTEPEINCLLDFISVIFHWSWFFIMSMREYFLVVLAVGYQETYVKVVVNMTQVKVAGEVEGIVATLVVNLRHWEGSQPSRFHLLVDIW